MFGPTFHTMFPFLQVNQRIWNLSCQHKTVAFAVILYILDMTIVLLFSDCNLLSQLTNVNIFLFILQCLWNIVRYIRHYSIGQEVLHIAFIDQRDVGTTVNS